MDVDTFSIATQQSDFWGPFVVVLIYSILLVWGQFKVGNGLILYDIQAIPVELTSPRPPPPFISPRSAAGGGLGDVALAGRILCHSFPGPLAGRLGPTQFLASTTGARIQLFLPECDSRPCCGCVSRDGRLSDCTPHDRRASTWVGGTCGWHCVGLIRGSAGAWGDIGGRATCDACVPYRSALSIPTHALLMVKEVLQLICFGTMYGDFRIDFECRAISVSADNTRKSLSNPAVQAIFSHEQCHHAPVGARTVRFKIYTKL